MKTDILSIGEDLRNGVFTCQEYTRKVIDQIQAHPELQAFSALTQERALREAAQAQSELDQGLDRGPLHGVPYAVKAIFDVAGQVNHAGAKPLANRVAAGDAAVIRQLQEAGAVLVGLTHTSPLAATILGVNPSYGTPRHPTHKAHIPGGSSSGSAVAVAAGLTPFALGSDTGGSIRVPAAFCGTVGLKPKIGDIDTTGMCSLAPSLDTVGLMTTTVKDAAIVYETLAQRTLANPGLEGLRFCMPETVFFDQVHQDVEAAVRATANAFENMGAILVERPLPELPEILALMQHTSLIAAEAYPEYASILPQSDWVVHWLNAAGAYTPDRVATARRRRTDLAKALYKRLEDIDLWLVPTTAVPAPLLADASDISKHRTLSALISRNTFIGNLMDWYGLSLPCGRTHENLPIGLMVYGQNPAPLFRAARALEHEQPLVSTNFQEAT